MKIKIRLPNKVEAPLYSIFTIMSFIAGINYFELRTFTFSELNLPLVDERKKYSIAVVEAYFHLLGIPLFSLGKRRKLSYFGDYTDLPENLRQQIDPKIITARGKWYSFAGVYMLIITLAGFYADRKVEENRLGKLFAEDKRQQETFLQNPAVGDTYFFLSKGEDIRGEVHRISADSVQITVQVPFQYQKSGAAKKDIFSGLKTDKERMQAFVRLQERKNLISDSLKSAYPQEKMLRTLITEQILGTDISFIQFWISKFDLKKSFCPENNCKGTAIPNSANQFPATVVLKKVERETTKY